MIRLLIADDERMEREALADIVMRRFEHEVTVGWRKMAAKPPILLCSGKQT